VPKEGESPEAKEAKPVAESGSKLEDEKAKPQEQKAAKP
jgi:hypothetical protein